MVAPAGGPPPGATFDLVEVPRFSLTAEHLDCILAAPSNAVGRPGAGLQPQQEPAAIAEALASIAGHWWKEATMYRGPLSADGLPRGAAPSAREAYCRRVAKKAHELLLELGAQEDGSIPASVQQGDAGVRAQLDPDSRLRDGLANLAGLVGVDGARISPAHRHRRRMMELHYAPAMATASVPSELPEMRRVDDQVLLAAIAGVALVREHALLSADGWLLRARQRRRRAGGAPEHYARPRAVQRLTKCFDWTFGLRPGGWKAPIRGVQAKSFEAFSSFVVSFADCLDAQCSDDTRERFGRDGPHGLTIESARKLAANVERRRKSVVGEETSAAGGGHDAQRENDAAGS